MSENGENYSIPLALNAATQVGPDGLEWISVHFGTFALSTAFAFPEEMAEEIIKSLTSQIREAATVARRKNRGFIIANGKIDK